MQDSWNIKKILLAEIEKQGGWVNAHSHLDRAYTITPTTLKLGNEHLHKKWEIVDQIKKSSTVDQIYDRMAFAVEQQLSQGVSVIGSFIDVDAVIKDKSIKAATKVREKYKKDLKLVFINQALKGVIEPEARKWFEEGAQFVDIIGGLPGKDAGKEAQHLDILFETAKKHKKMVHVHVDQLNTKEEKETELLIKKTIEHNLIGKVVAIHGISLAAHPLVYRKKIYQQMQQNKIMLIACPTAWIDSRRSEEISVTHNSIAPVEELIKENITVAIGTDNIADVYKPFTDGDMWTELRFLLETCHYYDLKQLVKIATKNGRKVLGIK
ncbi:MAG: hypothetical protein COU63_01895 [Candidatus Pacebacteria bacterium CG10_big_fil_rev_8_21_14_0_10_36_11]|nr:amidohydrolase family protein [Candidatus Pacearchaeota archaeon]OIP73668.1 MAG: hypothetical protein AUK08_03830 [Candidatus Pacebacteria bacterium CG2_30_36_39]PIR64750.1 MAG: hypothetical protein COU63_01895 [Candidatus Pacebacteria bacterium CG10_big_fil_rev_8_21_14_0_10_36_11]PJC43058.1 MAG: hypothetical protein CO040_01195 [Candidatus Pacebacteria bacterium CG_4_9_14_0_2_um_filter_36_8]